MKALCKNKSLKGTWPQALLSLAASILFVLSLRWLFIEPFVIPSGSMEPTLLVNEYVLVNKLAYGLRLPFSSEYIYWRKLPERGDVVVFRSKNNPSVFLVKRVVGVGGDLLQVSSTGEVKVNPTSGIEDDSSQLYHVPRGHFFAMGDNRLNSLDSRVWGAVPNSNVLGQPFLIWLSCYGSKIGQFSGCLHDGVRENRVFKLLGGH